MVETRSKKRKRQRLMSISSNVSSWPDLPARFESLNDDTLTTILEFVGNKSYRPFGGLNYHCKEIYLSSGMTKETYLYGYGPLSVIIDRYDRTSLKAIFGFSIGVISYSRRDVLDWVLEERKKDLLQLICIAAAAEERLNILEEVWNNIDEEDDKRYVFSFVDSCAASHGKLGVLKWYKDRGSSFDKEICALQAANRGHLHILQWLREEQDLELDGSLYNRAIENSGHICVLKWLRKEGCPWGRNHFAFAALRGNLAILQWLHDEGCPWHEYNCVQEGRVEHEVVNWCRGNGYGNRLVSRL